MKDAAIISMLTGQPWAMHRPVLESALAVLERREAGDRISDEELRLITQQRDRKQAQRRMDWGVETSVSADEERGYFYDGNVAVVPVNGMLVKNASSVNGISQPQGMSSAQVADTILRAGMDRKARSVLLDIHSPGGTVYGGTDMFDAVAQVKESGRPIVAFAHDLAASGAYWLASYADALYLTPAAEVGSIGVYQVLEDSSAALANRGVKRYLITSGKHKGGGAGGTEITNDHREAEATAINAMAEVFKRSVAENMGLTPEQIEELATGRTFIGQDAVDVGLAHGVTTYRALIGMMNEEGHTV